MTTFTEQSKTVEAAVYPHIVLYEKAHPALNAHFLIAIDQQAPYHQYLGGVRLMVGVELDAARRIVSDLAQAMTQKSAALDLPTGGAKAAIICQDKNIDRVRLFEAFGEMVETLQGRYITALDAGVHEPDMDIVGTKTSHVTCKSTMNDDVSYFTALGVFKVMDAVSEKPLSQSRIMIQGAGKCGAHLAALLCEVGATVLISDIRPEKVARLQASLPVEAVSVEHDLDTPCDIFAPCALGDVLTETSIQQLQCKLIAGTANCQLASPEVEAKLAARGIQYCPDYVINAGGLIGCVKQYFGGDDEMIEHYLTRLVQNLMALTNRA